MTAAVWVELFGGSKAASLLCNKFDYMLYWKWKITDNWQENAAFFFCVILPRFLLPDTQTPPTDIPLPVEPIP